MLKTFWLNGHVSKNLIQISKRVLFDKLNCLVLDLAFVKLNPIINGSQKCGTTSLHEHLGKHPVIFLVLQFFTM